MRLPFRVWSTVILCLGACLLGVTGASIIAVRARASDPGQEADRPPTKHESTPEEIAAQKKAALDPEAVARWDRAMVSHSQMKSIDVSVDGREATVTAQVSLIERRPALQHHWSLFVHGESFDRTFVARHYDKKLFSVPLDDKSEATFSEKIKLAPGTYQVEVVLHAVPEGFDLSSLKDKDIEKGHRKLSKIAKVKIPD